MAYDTRSHATLRLHKSGLRVNGVENQELRLLLRVARLRFTAINGLGIPLLDEVFKVANEYPTIRSAMLALAEDLRRGSDIHGEPTAPVKYHDSLAQLRAKIEQFQYNGASSDETLETIACVMLLVTAGFPGSRDNSCDWALHIGGMVSLVELLGSETVQSTAIGRLARDMAAQFSIGLFSLGNRSLTNEVWLTWDVHPPEIQDGEELSSLETILGYPRSLVTILATMSSVFRQSSTGDVSSSTADVVQRLFDKATRDQPLNPLLRAAGLIEMLETCLALWQPPENLSGLSMPVRLAVTSAWEVMRKAAIIHLWRGGFSANLLAPMSEDKKRSATRFIREMVLTMRALLTAVDEQRITIMNVMAWPVAVIANEASDNKALQQEILTLLSDPTY
ncbi:hypothetical protein F5X68DRAFT_244146 [Plectosphaerella plurivora]|uniref:Uncharacterized protein n=1 Tax=Plectosphaerella plurivora TaxID=936078 RepID=A0A9P8VKV2_9PEZI|nr:hypothetical protein F5X68DRAFT_244146 [Plectosphaerella plurivora]